MDFAPDADSKWPPGAKREPLLNRLIRFGRALNAKGVAVNPSKLIDLCRSFELIDISNRMDFYAAARAIFVARQDDLAIFDALFFEYWTLLERKPNSDPGSGDDETGDGEEQGLKKEKSPQKMGDDASGGESDEEDTTQTGYSAEEVLVSKNIAQMSDEEIERARDVMADLISILASVRSRRTAVENKGRRLDLRRMMRKNLVYGHDATQLVYRRKQIKKIKLMLLCDVSGSMERYSNFLIQFIYALRRELPEVNVGVFATHLTVITDLLDERNVADSLARVSKNARDWGGGTDIGACLREFNEIYARDMLRSKTVMVILSDGWDRGDETVMSNELERIHRRTHKLIWLNPLLGTTGYEPLCRGIRTALPYMDYFLPAHNLESLAQLAKTLRSVWH